MLPTGKVVYTGKNDKYILTWVLNIIGVTLKREYYD